MSEPPGWMKRAAGLVLPRTGKKHMTKHEVEPFGSQEDLDRFNADVRYFDEEVEPKFLPQYHGQFVGIFRKRLIGPTEDLDKLLDRIDREGAECGLDLRGRVFVQQIRTPEEREEGFRLARSIEFHSQPR